MEAQGGAAPAEGAPAAGATTATAAAAPAGTGLPAFGHAEFSGHAEARLEPSGRVIIPAAFRYAFTEDRIPIRPKTGDFLALYTRAGFNQFLDKALASQPDKLLDPRLRVDAYALVDKVAVDRQWRIVIPPKMRDEVELGDEVVFVGALESLKIMSPEKAEEVFERARMVNVLLDSWSGLPTDPV